MKRAMPGEHLKHNNNKYNNAIMSLEREETGTSHVNHQHLSMQQTVTLKHAARPVKRRKHNDSISESILIKEKLPSASLATIGKNNNVLIPRNSRTILDNIDLKGTDGAALKKLMNNNNGDLTNGVGGADDSFNNDDDDDENEMDNNSDSETVTGDESLFEPEEEEDEDETESEDEEYLEEVELDRKHYNNKRITL
jgi:hypothetical protein